MKQIALIGAGKMGISHLSILSMHPDVNIVAVADQSALVTDILKKFTRFPIFRDYNEMLQNTSADAVIVATPTKYHEEIVQQLLEKNIHVFVEKPFSMNLNSGKKLVETAKQKGIVNQVGYHNKFIGTFMETKKIIDSGFLGEIFHFSGFMYGPVVVSSKDKTWRSDSTSGGGCLMDYAAHVIDLLNYLVAPLDAVRGAQLFSMYSGKVEDAVFSLLETKDGVPGSINVSWSDYTYRKMSTSVTITGSNGKIEVDPTELKIYFKTSQVPAGYEKGWNIKHINTLAPPVKYYLRGEEYSAQLDKFVDAISGLTPNDINTFESAYQTDLVMNKIKNYN
jgi:predicted dehydrogenase